MQIVDGVYWVGVNDTRTKLFESLWSLPRGVSYNSYLILGGEKKVLIDTVKEDFFEEYVTGLKRYINPADIDYIVLNHVEPDHAGALSKMLSLASKASVIGTAKAMEFVKTYHRVPFDVMAVSDGTTVDLGGKTLKFVDAACIHWPETMFTYLAEDHVLFSGDAFGSFGEVGDKVFDDRDDKEVFKKEAERYFASIISPYASFVTRAIKKIDALGVPIRVIAPSHGLVYRDNPSEIKSLYGELSAGRFEEKVVVIYGSMYGNTKTLAEAVARGVAARGVRAVLFDVSHSDPSEILSEVWRAPALAVGSPVYDSFIFPPITNLLEILKLKRMKRRVFGIFGSYTWGGTPLEQIRKTMEGLNSETVGATVRCRGSPTSEDVRSAEDLGGLLAEVATRKSKETSASL